MANYLQPYSEDDNYYSHVRTEVLELVPSGARRLLDVGCSNGATAAAAKERFSLERVVGIEIFPDAAAEARKRLDGVLEGNVEDMELPFGDGYFDCIICADVLEHLQNPWRALVRLRRVLSPQGVVIASIPNIGHIAPLLKIVFDRFEYEESGILDKTHLRFFTLHTIKNMFHSTGFVVEEVRANRSRSWKFLVLRILTLGLFRRAEIVQYIVRARKIPDAHES